jgi:integrase/recombinase XerD
MTINNELTAAPAAENLDLFKNRFRQNMEVLNRSQITVKEYLYGVDKFIAFLNSLEVFNIEGITKEHISMYQKDLYYRLNYKGQQNVASTHNNYLKAVKCFCLFLKNEGYLAYSPAKDIQYAREPKQLPRTILTIEEIKKLFKAVDTKTHVGYRDRTIMELLYSTAIRRKELLNLKPQDVDYTRGLLKVNKGKGGKDRVVPIGKIACKYLENYIKLVRIDLQRKKESPYLFLSLWGNAIGNGTIHDIIYRYAKKAKLNKAVTPHVFRHTCATHLLQQKANIRCVQEILGHYCVETTQRYTQITITDLKEAHQQCHPREKETNY